MKFEYCLVSCVDFLKRQFRCRTYYIENVFVALCLAAVVMIFGRTQLEWIGALAVFFTFCHASVGFRLEEQQALLLKKTGHASVECFYKMKRYFLLKETCWFIYFTAIGAYSALVGVFIFLLYPWWRAAWRRAHPI